MEMWEKLPTVITVLKVIIRALCWAGVIGIAIYTCWTYFSYQTTANLSVKSTSQVTIVAFTVCPYEENAYKSDVLAKYGISREELQSGNYSGFAGLNISPVTVFNEASYALHDIMKEVQIRYLNTEQESYYVPLEMDLDPLKAVWRPKALARYGRCFSLEIGPEVSRYGIYKIYLTSKMGAQYYMHHPGQFMSPDSTSRLVSTMGEKLFIDIKFGITEDTLGSASFQELPCSSEMNRGFDDCLFTNIQNNLVEEFGCSLPWFLHADDGSTTICGASDSALTTKMHTEFAYRVTANWNKFCYKSCTTTQVFSGMDQYVGWNNDTSEIEMFLRSSVKVKKTVLNYTLTNLYAEIGGYVGLLLGISVVNITVIVDLVYSWIIDTSLIEVSTSPKD